MNYKTSIRLLFEAVLSEGERKMRGYSDKYSGGPAEKQLMTSKTGTLSASGKKQLAAAATAYEKATSKKVESIRNIFNNILKEAAYQAGKATQTGEDGEFVGVAKLSKSKIKGLDRQDAINKSRRRAERNAANQEDAAFRSEHGKLSPAKRREANRLYNRPQGMRHKDPQAHYPQD